MQILCDEFPDLKHIFLNFSGLNYGTMVNNPVSKIIKEKFYKLCYCYDLTKEHTFIVFVDYYVILKKPLYILDFLKECSLV